MSKDLLKEIKKIEDEIALIECGDEKYAAKRAEWHKLKKELSEE